MRGTGRAELLTRLVERRDKPMPTNWVLAAIEQHSSSTSTALADATRSLSYAEMWKKSGALAAQLGVLGNRPIAISMERGLEEAIAILAVLRAGAFYVPIDPKAPAARGRRAAW